jgi:hypothetical protein
MELLGLWVRASIHNKLRSCYAGMPPIQPGDRRGINMAKRWGRTFFKSDLAMDLIDRGSDSTHSTRNPRDDVWYTDAPN